ncbi:MAG: hypothetical protein L0387_24640 [Acidobacteria bacterium]|nr:hypothetical protein [Acidobacteriota bacterium]MCI0624793.1 hypothetical protein [Acidobacteriota bacterium]MCI0719080.1 hypothetical protein [Acidobacteriota bacterium]
MAGNNPEENRWLSALRQQEVEIIKAALKKTRGKIYGPNGAAELLGVKPTTLSTKLTRLGIHRLDFMNG